MRFCSGQIYEDSMRRPLDPHGMGLDTKNVLCCSNTSMGC